jgi:cbb3-type cytochrome oxidase subunit 3
MANSTRFLQTAKNRIPFLKNVSTNFILLASLFIISIVIYYMFNKNSLENMDNENELNLELDNIEEIVIGTNGVTGAPGGAPGATPNAGGAGLGDTVQIFGNFSETSLLLNTITVNGTAAAVIADAVRGCPAQWVALFAA